MPVSTANVFLYAATVGDYEMALAAAEVSGIPIQNVTGNFSQAWSAVLNGSDLVIAVGGAAVYSLYYNPCGWSNPSGLAGGHTPFEMFPLGQGIDAAKASYFVNAGGYTAMDSLKLSTMLAYYAVHGAFPAQLTGLPRQETPQQVCVSNASPTVKFPPDPTAPQVSSSSGGVGVYATFSSTQNVVAALQEGWKGIGVTGGLGTQAAPYTTALPNHPDLMVSQALTQTNANAFWLSFWTVSWPSGGDSFYDGAYKAGVFVAQTISGYKGKYQPNFVIIDPEGYNTPASNATEWSEWLHGWSDGIKSVNANLTPAFYTNQWQYTTYDLATVNLPSFVAVSPISGNSPVVKGGNIQGYIAYYAACPAQSSVQQTASWGGRFNTVQFRDSGVDCAP